VTQAQILLYSRLLQFDQQQKHLFLSKIVKDGIQINLIVQPNVYHTIVLGPMTVIRVLCGVTIIATKNGGMIARKLYLTKL
jgi:hypothetical protein